MSRKVFIMQRNVDDTAWETKTISGTNTPLILDNSGGLATGSSSPVSRPYASFVASGSTGSFDATLDLADGPDIYTADNRLFGEETSHTVIISLTNTENITRFNWWVSHNILETDGGDLNVKGYSNSFIVSSGNNTLFVTIPPQSSALLQFVKYPGSTKFVLWSPPLIYNAIIGPHFV